MWSLYISFFVLVVIGLWGLYHQVILKEPFGDIPRSNEHMELFFTLSCGVLILIMFLVSRMKLVTVIEETGIRFGFETRMRQKFIAKFVLLLFGIKFWGRFTYGLMQKSISKESISRYEVRKYKPLSEYGGWGYRKIGRGLFKKQVPGVSYSVNGNMGLQLYLTNGEKILIGTHEAEGVGRAMKKLMNEGGIVNG